MADAWQSIEEAALTLGISTRTLHRRISKEEFQTRLNAGRREVLVTIPLPDTVSGAAFFQADARIELSDASADTPLQPSFPGVTASDSAANIAPPNSAMADSTLALHEDRIRRTDLAILAYQQSLTAAARDTRRSRLASRYAWATAAVMAIAVSIAAVLVTQRLTQADSQVQTLTRDLQSATDTSATQSKELAALRSEAESARIAAANAQGQLSVMAAAAHQPATRPASPFQRLTSLLAGTE